MRDLHLHLLLDQIGEVIDTTTTNVWRVCSNIRINNMKNVRTFYEIFKNINYYKSTYIGWKFAKKVTKLF
jgi:hypothetical protein